ncbi:bestrophin family ion channel [Sphingobacterium sp. WM]|uniref:bestrophin family protein n=1 Tax=Sphingobacterium sp. WM TaxID=3031802 RepID=UPI00240E5E5B|nr:bestrophin family ion channel [Sphingobacterium sp. WM]WFB65341.1 bestrophin family ion channel [Sphingobacterium sp. WM]
MIVYNPKDWFKTISYLHNSKIFKRLLPYLIISVLVSWALAYWELEYLKLSDRTWMRNITTVHNLLGFVLSLLLVFRTNTAYDRWWEARKQWGALTNSSRTLAIKLNAFLYPEDKVSRSFYKKSIPLFAETLFNYLRSDYTKFMLDEVEHPELRDLDEKKHGPNQVAGLIYKKTNILYAEGKITGDQLIVLNKELTSLTEITGACERIKNTPIPLGYSAFIKTFIVLYTVTLPIGLVFSMGYFVVAAVPFIFYVLATLEMIGESIEEPFGGDSDDLPIDKIAANIKKHFNELMQG